MQNQGTKVGSAYIEITGKNDDFKRKMSEVLAQGRRTTADVTTGFARMGEQSRKFSARMVDDMHKVNGGARVLTGSLHGFHGVLAGLGVTVAAIKLRDLADEFSLMRSRIRLVTAAGEDMLKIEEQLAQQAMTNRADLKETVGLYTRLRQSRKDLTDAATQNLVDKWSKSLIISASSAQEAASSTQQFAQAMAAGILSGQELRSVIQGNSAFAVYLAEGLGVATGELKQLGEEGKITVDAILGALEKSGGAIEHDFAKKALTVHQALTNIETATIRLVGVTDQQFGVSGTIAVWVNSLSNAINDLATLMQGPAKQADDAIAKMRAANQAVLNDQPALLDAHKKLEEAIASQGVAAEETARLEVNAIATRIAKNKELAISYQALARVKLEEAKSALRGGEWKNSAGMDPQAFRSLTMDRIRVKQELNQPLNPSEVKFLENEVRLDQLRADIQGLEKTIADIDKGIGTLPVDPPLPPKPPALPPLPTIPTTITELAGYYTELEQLERDLADIRAAEAEGATGASRAAVKAMLDYLDATGDVVTVLEKMKGLSGDILSADDAALISGFVNTVRAGRILDSRAGTRGQVKRDETTDPKADHWATYEQRVAEATKLGLMQAVETGQWGDAFGQILFDVTREALSNALDVLWDALAAIKWDGTNAGWGGFFNMVGSSIGGSFKPMAGGGPVSAGQMLRVGELGSEWFMPKTDGYIIPHGVLGKSLSAPMQVSVGDTHLHVNGLANGVTTDQLAAVLEAHTRALPAAIDARVRDRQKRGAY